MHLRNLLHYMIKEKSIQLIEHSTPIMVEEISHASNSIYWRWKLNQKKVFFKLLSVNEASEEINNLNIIVNKIPFPQLIQQYNIDDNRAVLVYENKNSDDGRIDWIDFLSKCNFSLENISAIYTDIFNTLKRLHRESMTVDDIKDYPLRALYENRKDNWRIEGFYGIDLIKIFEDMWNNHLSYKNQILELFNFQTKNTLYSLNHWDLHDWNYALRIIDNEYQDMCFFDVATAWYNPILADFGTYFRYLAVQSAYLFPKYKNWFIDSLQSPLEYIKRQDLIFHKFKKLVINEVIKVGIEKYPARDRKREFASRLLYRLIGIKNILEYSLEDRYRLYTILINILNRSKTSTSIVDLPLWEHIYSYIKFDD